ncbi:MAG: FecR domain-containing protein [Myxococcales bacterium]|nr:FecR domain-containing protein [Myxococcales bacterium]
MSTCNEVNDELADLVAGDREAIARHAEHLATCDACRDARHEATELAALIGQAGADHVAPSDLTAKLMAAIGADPVKTVDATKPVEATTPVVAAKPEAKTVAKPEAKTVAKTEAKTVAKTEATSEAKTVAKTVGTPAAAHRRDEPTPIRKTSIATRVLLYAGAAAAVIAGGVGIHSLKHADDDDAPIREPMANPMAGGIGKVTTIARAAADGGGGVQVKAGSGWRPIAKGELIGAGATIKTDERTRVGLLLADGTTLVLDHATELAFDAREARKISMTAGRMSADVAHVEGRPASVITPSGTIDVIGTKFMVTATEALTSVQVVRGSVALTTSSGTRDEVHAGEEGVIDRGALQVGAAPSLAHELSWSELEQPAVTKDDETTAGLGSLRAYKPGEKRDRDWKLALAKHDVKVRIVGPIARTEITETFRNDSAETLEGVYKFPLPADAQVDGLELDVDGGYVTGAFVDKSRAQKIWQGVIDKAAPVQIARPSQEIIWVPGRWRDPALLDWKRGGRFELKIFPIPAKGARTVKLSYTQVVTPRGPFRQYTYPLAHSTDGSTVADNFTVDVEIRGAMPGLVRTQGYQMVADPARKDLTALTLTQGGFVPRGDLVVDYRAVDGDAELRAWTFAGGAAVAPDDKLAEKKNVGIDPKVVEAQRVVAADARPTAVLALRPNLPRWRETKPRDFMIVVDSSQSMVGERWNRAGELATAMIDQMDRRDRFSVAACDSECARLGDMRAPSAAAVTDVKRWLAAQVPAGASDVVASIRSAAEFPHGEDREKWVLYIGDGFASTGFRKVGDVEKALGSVATAGVHVSTIGIGGDADLALLAAAARGGGGSYLAWLPGQSVGIAALAALESSNGASLRDATVELPAGLADVAPTVLPTIRNGEEVLLAARMGADVKGDVVVRGIVGGKPFEQRYPLDLKVSTAAGNGFVPRLWATLAIEQLERRGESDTRTKIVALSQGYGVMSRETSLLVLESQAMFDAFGVDRSSPTAKWTGEEQLDEVVAAGTIPVTPPATTAAQGKAERVVEPSADKATATTAPPSPPMKKPSMDPSALNKKDSDGAETGTDTKAGKGASGGGMIDQNWGRSRNLVAMRRTWVRVPSVSAYDGVTEGIKKAIANSEAALASNPDSREKHRALVQALAYAGEIDRAREVAGKWLDRDKLDPQALGYQADLLGRDGQRELALRTLAGLVDLDADRAALHERMVRAYEMAGRLSQACAHRIALTALAPKDAAVAGATLRCLRSIGRDQDAEIVAKALPDDSARAAAEKAATVPAIAPKLTGDLLVSAHWEANADLDLSIVTPAGERVSWMGGRPDVTVGDAASSDKEQLALKSIKRGNYLVEITRGGSSTGPIRGTVDITVLGTKKTLPFELLGSRAVVGRLAISLEERLEQVFQDDGLVPVRLNPRVQIGTSSDAAVDRVVKARAGVFRACYQREVDRNPSAQGRLIAQLTIEGDGTVSGVTMRGSGGMDLTSTCVNGNLRRLRFPATGTRSAFALPFVFSAQP